MLKDKLNIYGKVSLCVNRKDGTKESFSNTNLVVNRGLETLIKVLKSAMQKPVLNIVASGNGTDPVTPDQTGLSGSVVTSVPVLFTSLDDFTVRGFFTIPFDKHNGSVISELGLFSGTDLFSRVLVSPIEKNNTIQVSGYWDLSSEPIATFILIVSVAGGVQATIKLNDDTKIGDYVSFSDLSPDDYTLTVSAPNYQEQVHEINVVDSNITKSIELVPTAYDVKISVVPDYGTIVGGVMELNGMSISQIGNSFYYVDLMPGTYPYSITIPKYKVISGQVVVINKNIDIQVSAIKRRYEVRINIPNMVSDVGVKFDNEVLPSVPESPVVISNVLPGTYSYELTQVGFATSSGSVVVGEANMVISVYMVLLRYRLTVEVNPAGGMLKIGNAPFVLVPSSPHISTLDYGSHQLTYKKEGFITLDSSVILTRDTVKNMTLTPAVQTVYVSIDYDDWVPSTSSIKRLVMLYVGPVTDMNSYHPEVYSDEFWHTLSRSDGAPYPVTFSAQMPVGQKTRIELRFGHIMPDIVNFIMPESSVSKTVKAGHIAAPYGHIYYAKYPVLYYKVFIVSAANGNLEYHVGLGETPEDHPVYGKFVRWKNQENPTITALDGQWYSGGGEKHFWHAVYQGEL